METTEERAFVIDRASGKDHRCKKNVFCFFILVKFFTFLTFFYFPNVFFIFKSVDKVQSGKQINMKHSQNNSNEIQK